MGDYNYGQSVCHVWSHDPLQNDQAMLEEEKLLLEEEKMLLEERVQELTLQLEKAQVHLITIGRVLNIFLSFIKVTG